MPAALLPPGQRTIEGFPRFGTYAGKPVPTIPAAPVIEIRGAVTAAFEVSVASLAGLPRHEVVADLHCVAGWTVAGLHWEGVAFQTFFRTIIEPALEPGAVVTHLVFRGLDRHRSDITIADALADGVLIAEHLGGVPLDDDHGAPVRLVSPTQYGYMSTKHLCSIEVRTSAPTAHRLTILGLLLKPHPRARVSEQERHGFVPGWLIGPVYRAIKAPLLFLSTRRGRGSS